MRDRRERTPAEHELSVCLEARAGLGVAIDEAESAHDYDAAAYYRGLARAMEARLHDLIRRHPELANWRTRTMNAGQ